MRTDQHWREQAKGILKAELKRRGVTYQELASRLTRLGVEESAENIANKISRGKFTFVFLLQCLEAIDCDTLRVR